MALIKQALSLFLVASLFVTTNALASDLLVNTTIADSQGDAHGGWIYEVDKMDIQWDTDGQVTVDIYTNFVDYNNEKGTGRRNGKIVLGDLLMSTDGANTPYNYAFMLSDADRNRNDYWRKNHWDNTGRLNQISSTISSKQYHNNSGSVQNGQVMGGSVSSYGEQAAWTVDRQNAGSSYNNFDVISFSFNVSGIDAFKNASQVAFSWTMSCANDVVQGVVDVAKVTSVPEPTTFLLMLIALGVIANTKRKKVKAFSA
ncbi:PEP-CTERM sorting domain-containing protein [Colwellia sp. D2M02]|uniref:Ice-binding protein C-terminal domain-containing protein n=1 Tax=Colwellia asteriadis TaxID=517723 RepID=A0ABP3WGP9_9GAMM|nr:PEP-CTERM sorting domain-containing protein [Colwellia sp. D2M02]MBU2892314.1 PEP-CTERM sorting domain-containing protein [Colwellia sp. D2M02]